MLDSVTLNVSYVKEIPINKRTRTAKPEYNKNISPLNDVFQIQCLQFYDIFHCFDVWFMTFKSFL